MISAFEHQLQVLLCFWYQVQYPKFKCLFDRSNLLPIVLNGGLIWLLVQAYSKSSLNFHNLMEQLRGIQHWCGNQDLHWLFLENIPSWNQNHLASTSLPGFRRALKKMLPWSEFSRSRESRDFMLTWWAEKKQ